ncbi:uncharacterized protein LOC107620297 [Arachis ipaensis]|uniref:uncharacterized protein LOC107620297 n=1 Tax=Arachis ipaensis TaxID=130454 RepID=UPI0007AFDD9C|nr:uncharacterized protein LOC107620297 [Arachis ipaensis]
MEEEVHNHIGEGAGNHAGQERRLHIFYEGLSQESKKALDHSFGGSLNKKKMIEEAIDVIETVANNEYFYSSYRSTNRRVMELNHMDTILAQNKMITKQLADLTKQMERSQAAAIHTQPPAQEELNTEEGGDWEQSQPPISNSPSEDRLSRIEALLENLCKEVQDNKTFKDEVRSSMKSQGEAIKKLESQVGYLSQQILKSTDSFPSDTEKNPRGETKNVRWKECKAITLRDEEILEEMNCKPLEHKSEDSKKNLEETEQGVGPAQMKEPMEKKFLKLYVPKAPFPQRLRGGEKEKTYSRFLDTFKSLHINIPFIETLQQMPSYIKCMKELLTKKTALKGGQTVVMNKESSALIQKELLVRGRS